VRLLNVYQEAGGLDFMQVYTVERLEVRAGTRYILLVGDPRPWKAERFKAEI
jgi:hypothetical protein